MSTTVDRSAAGRAEGGDPAGAREPGGVCGQVEKGDLSLAASRGVDGQVPADRVLQPNLTGEDAVG
jgi:hypothetical protein